MQEPQWVGILRLQGSLEGEPRSVLPVPPAGTPPRTWPAPGSAPSPTARDWQPVCFHFKCPQTLLQVSPIFQAGTSDKIHLVKKRPFPTSLLPRLLPWLNNVVRAKTIPGGLRTAERVCLIHVLTLEALLWLQRDRGGAGGTGRSFQQRLWAEVRIVWPQLVIEALLT